MKLLVETNMLMLCKTKEPFYVWFSQVVTRTGLEDMDPFCKS